MKSSLKILACFLFVSLLLDAGAELYGQDRTGHVLISPELKVVELNDTFSIYAGIDTVKTVKDFLIDIEVDTGVIRLDSCKRVPAFFTGPNGAFVYWKDTVQHFSEGDSAYVYEIQGSVFGPGNFVDGPGNLVSMKFTAHDYGLSRVAYRYYELHDTLVDPYTHIGQLIELDDALDGAVAVCPPGEPLLYIDKEVLAFSAEVGHGNPSPQAFHIDDPCIGALDWSASENADWFSLDSYSGPAPSEIRVMVDMEGMAPGNYIDSILIEAEDAANSPGYVKVSLEIAGDYLCGDTNADLSVDISDAVYIINYVFIGGDPPTPLNSGDTNCDASVDISDAVYIINFVFIGGNTPCDTDGDGTPEC